MRENRSCGIAVGVVSTMLLMGAALADEGHGGGRNVRDLTFANMPNFPTCAAAAVENGDPSKGPSVVIAKAKTGCVVPWHWHMANEQVMVVSGTARLEMKDGTKPLVLKAGGYALMPSKHVHQFRCMKSCTMFIHSDAAFDIHYVGPEGTEITPEQALKAVRETVATK